MAVKKKGRKQSQPFPKARKPRGPKTTPGWAVYDIDLNKPLSWDIHPNWAKDRAAKLKKAGVNVAIAPRSFPNTPLVSHKQIENAKKAVYFQKLHEQQELRKTLNKKEGTDNADKTGSEGGDNPAQEVEKGDSVAEVSIGADIASDSNSRDEPNSN